MLDPAYDLTIEEEADRPDLPNLQCSFGAHLLASIPTRCPLVAAGYCETPIFFLLWPGRP
jgi:hypothetical protein